MKSFEDGPWPLGLNSVADPCSLQPGAYQWAVNCVNKGGVVATRPGMSCFTQLCYDASMENMTIFTPKNGVPNLVMILSSGILQSVPYPFTGTPGILGNQMLFNAETVQFETAVIGVTQAPDGTVTAINPFPVLMICDGVGRTAMWDGTSIRYLDPDPNGAHETPVCDFMKWIGNRLWVSRGRKIRVSNILNPIKFTEEDILAEGGYFNLPSICTGFGVTPDFHSLLAFTDYTTTSFQAGIINRSSWFSTTDFQKVIFGNIGCAAPRSIVTQYGMVWWYSHSGLMNLDSALQTYRSSEARYKDTAMRRSRANFSDDISKICAGVFENYLILSVPSGDSRNFHTWVLDGNPAEASYQQAFSGPPQQWSSVWTGTRPTQWATGNINGKSRCFFSSADLPPTGSSALIRGGIWEAFTQDRRDIGTNLGFTATAKDIQCGVETRQIYTGGLHSVKYVELDLSEIIGTVTIDIYYAPRLGTYKKFGTKQVVGTIGSVTKAMTLPVKFEQKIPQRRSIRSSNESVVSTDKNPGVEGKQNSGIDKYFSILVKWTGQMSLNKIKVYADEYPEQMDGTPTENETTDRYIRPDGTGAVLSTGPTDIPIVTQQSGFSTINSPRWAESIYQSTT